MLLLLTTAFLLKRYGTQAVPLPAPAPTSSTFEAPIFARDDPSDVCHSRTVLDILWSCIATTFACTWVSVHPNVPFKGEGRWTLLRRRIFLMFFSILAPEFMIVWAFKQWRGAVMIREAFNEASRKAFPDPRDPRRNPWTTTHGHLLQMGGFRVSLTLRESNIHSSLSPFCDQLFYRRETSKGTWTTDNFPNNRVGDAIWEGVLNVRTLKALLTKNLIRFPTITEDEINDKSKGDALSKGIALLQLTWFIVQIITRAAQGLAITELELTTAALAGLNSVMYIFWWNKPRDVRFPVVIRTKGVEELLAERSYDTKWSFTDQKFDFRKHLWTSMTTPIKKILNSLGDFLISFAEIIARQIGIFARHLHSSFCDCYRYFVNRSAKHDEVNYVTLRDVSLSPSGTAHNISSYSSKLQKICQAFISGAKSMVYCFAFLLSVPAYVIAFGLIVPTAQILESNGDDVTFLPMVFDEVELVRVFSMMFYSEDAEVMPLFSTASIAGGLFGGVHCLAWHFTFSSHVEQIVWRAASLGITSACALSFVGSHTMYYINDIDGTDIIGKICSFSLRLLGLISLLLTIVVYPVSRLMLLVLTVTSLRSLPPSAFDTVQWIEFVPHI